MKSFASTIIRMATRPFQHRAQQTFWKAWDSYLDNYRLSHVADNKLLWTRLLLERFELFEQATHTFFPDNAHFSFSLDDVNGATMEAVWTYTRFEPDYQERYPDIFQSIYSQIEQRVRMTSRSHNTASQYTKRFRAFMNWCVQTGRTTNQAFRAYTIRGERYYSPYYLTIAERDQLRDFVFTNKSISRARDIFLFQCLTGERYSDLCRFLPSNISTIEVLADNGEIREVPALVYLAKKTSQQSETRPIRVPLCNQALTIIDRYRGIDKRGRLFPVPSLRYYNVAIKSMLKACGITRQVEILDPSTGRLVAKPICDLAGSHIARRTCIGSLFKKGVSCEVISSISGHRKGSKAISRYYEVDEEQKLQAILSIE